MDQGRTATREDASMKNRAAVAMGKRRWKGKTKAQRRAYALMLVAARKQKRLERRRRAGIGDASLEH